MVDKLTPAERSRRMAAVRQKDTVAEIIVRKILYRAGFRYRLQNRHLPGSPDIVLLRWRKAIFVHGCFWHGHDCSLFKLPATRTEWWAAKVEGNRARDRRAESALIESGWRVVTVWQCAFKGVDRLGDRVLRAALINAIGSSSPSIEVRGTLRAVDVRKFRSSDGGT